MGGFGLRVLLRVFAALGARLVLVARVRLFEGDFSFFLFLGMATCLKFDPHSYFFPPFLPAFTFFGSFFPPFLPPFLPPFFDDE